MHQSDDSMLSRTKLFNGLEAELLCFAGSEHREVQVKWECLFNNDGKL